MIILGCLKSIYRKCVKGLVPSFTELCPEDMVINQITIKSNHTQSGQPYEEYFGDIAPVNLPLYNGPDGNSTVEVHVKEKGTPNAQFWTIQADVENAEEVIFILMDEDGNPIKTLKVLLHNCFLFHYYDLDIHFQF